MLLRYFAERRLLALVITLVIVILGIGSLLTIKRDVFPNVDFDQVLITTAYPGASPEDVELMVTNRIEGQIKGVRGIKRFVSWSRENVSTIYVVLDSNERESTETILDIRQSVSRVTGFPREVTESPRIIELGTSNIPVIEIGLVSDLPYKQLREVAKRFERKLERLEEVSYVSTFGIRQREVHIEVDPNKMHHYQMSLEAIVNSVDQRNIRATGGNIESYTSEKNIVTLSQFRETDEDGEVIVRASFNGPLVKIQDLAHIRDTFEEEKVLSRVNGQKAISFLVFKSEDSDIIRTVGAVRKMVEDEKNSIPTEVKLLVSNDQSKYVKQRLSIVTANGLIGLLLVVCTLVLCLSFRTALWVSLGIPVSLLGTVFLLSFYGYSLDTVSMTAMILVLGIIVDDAIIIAESIHQRYEQGLPPLDAAVEGVRDVFKPVLTTMLTTCVVFLPIFFMPGMLGKFVYGKPLVL